MPDKTYYAVLGVSRRESPAGIRAANRELAQPAPEPVSLFAQPEDTHPSFQAFYDRYARNFTGQGVPKSEHPESLTLDVVLSPAEARLGCSIPVGVPVFRPCPECGGTGHTWPYACAECHASGLVEDTRVLLVRVPPQVHPGTILELPLDLFGVGNLYLRVHVSISNAA